MKAILRVSPQSCSLLRILRGILPQKATQQLWDGRLAGEGGTRAGRPFWSGSRPSAQLSSHCAAHFPPQSQQRISALSTCEAFIHGPCTLFLLPATLFPDSLAFLNAAHSSGLTLGVDSSRKSSPLTLLQSGVDVSLLNFGVDVSLLNFRHPTSLSRPSAPLLLAYSSAFPSRG